MGLHETKNKTSPNKPEKPTSPFKSNDYKTSNEKKKTSNKKKTKTKPKSLKILCTNADILQNKKDELELILHKDDIDVALISETLPKNTKQVFGQEDFLFEGYTTIQENTGRGVCIIHKENIKAQELPAMKEIYTPSIFMSFETKDKSLNLGIIYRSPNATDDDDSKVRFQIEKAAKELKNLILVGDFNHPEINWDYCHTKMHDNHRAAKFLFTVTENKLTQHINKPTHFKPNCKPSLIDLVFTKDQDLIDNVKIKSPLGKSYHAVIILTTSCKQKATDSCYIKKYKTDKADFQSMRAKLDEIEWEKVVDLENDTVDEAWKNLSVIIKTVRDEFVPTVTINTNKTRKRSLAFEDSLIHLTRLKRYHFKIYKKYPNQMNFNLYIQARAKVTKYTRMMKRKKERKIAKNIKHNTKAFYQYISSKTVKKDKIGDLENSQGQTLSSDEEKSNELNDFFTSVFTNEDVKNVPDMNKPAENITLSTTAEISVSDMKKLLEDLKSNKSPGPDEIHPQLLKECATQLATPFKLMFDLTLKEGKVPSEWKEAEITAIYKKKGSKKNPSNYRPISLTAVACKIMEKIIKKQLNEHLTKNNLLADEQYGFVAGRSTETQLLTSIHKWQEALDNDIPVDVVYMDFQKAFDSVPHVRLITKLKAYGIQGHLLSWIEDFLSNRTQHVKVNNSKSASSQVTSGVPQGSVLGPTLFVYFINDLPKSCIVSSKIFADDTKIYSCIETAEDKANMQATIDNLFKWTETWMLSFNKSKCQVLHLGDKNPRHSYFIGPPNDKIKLNVTTLEKDLGVHIDQKLTFEQHIEKITQKAASKCAKIIKNFTFRSEDVLVPIFKSLVRPVLEYANTAWSPGLRKHIDEIEKIQKNYTRCIYKVKHLSYKERLKKLKLPSLEFRRFRGDLIQTFKILRNYYDKSTVCSLFMLNENQNLRGHKYKLKKTYYKKLQYKNFFTQRVVNHWNKLPEHIVEADSVNSFKSKIDDHFKHLMYNTNLFN